MNRRIFFLLTPLMYIFFKIKRLPPLYLVCAKVARGTCGAENWIIGQVFMGDSEYWVPIIYKKFPPLSEILDMYKSVETEKSPTVTIVQTAQGYGLFGSGTPVNGAIRQF